ncbi:MAG: hypothetical protein BWY72_01576 [Bacteroidetes bacterium ADurb.Bin416]|nr:MAG: hypothetical protein BWY72_01576 [Bacteroidetes bacterium ADurb.Bin416]
MRMNDYFKLEAEQQRSVISQVANQTGLPVQAIEKDLWVSMKVRRIRIESLVIYMIWP